MLGGILRDELGFDGVIVSDALDMAGASGETGVPEAAVRAIAAGCDLLCVGTDTTDAELDGIGEALLLAVGSGRIAGERWTDAATRVARLARSAAQMPLPEFAEHPRPEFDPAVTAGRSRALSRFRRRRGSSCSNRAPTPRSASCRGGSRGRHPGHRAARGDPLPGGGPIVVAGRDLHRLAWTRDAVDRLRAADPRTVAVDLGWPAPDRAYADLAVFGGSRHVGEALRGMLDAHDRKGSHGRDRDRRDRGRRSTARRLDRGAGGSRPSGCRAGAGDR